MERREFSVGDIVRMRKPHPCGASEWEILRVGADFRLKCTGCGHQVMLPRREVEKFVKEVTKKLNHDLNGATRGIMLHY